MQIGMCMPYMELDYDRDTTLNWCRGIDAGPFSSLSCSERITSYAQDMRIILAAAAALPALRTSQGGSTSGRSPSIRPCRGTKGESRCF